MFKQSNPPIDFVIPWVDGNDPQWRAEKEKYQVSKTGDDRDVRYRDWGNLQYWFRAVERYAPWVNKVHFITWGHLPSWLNTNAEKLNIVKHSDYIPQKYLPTFNSHTIELNLHRIHGLAEHFAYFNDDTFLNAPVKPQNFFKNGKPVNRLILSALTPTEDQYASIVFNDTKIINKNFSKKTLLTHHIKEFFYPFYGIDGIRTWLMLPFPGIKCFYNDHLPTAYTKSLLEEVWAQEYDILDATSRHKFRDAADVSQALFRNWNMALGNITPCAGKRGKCFSASDDLLPQAILKEKYRMICCNDDELVKDFIKNKERLISTFERKYPQKSSFEL